MNHLEKHVVAVCAIIQDGHKILCTRRNDTGKWEFPGGKVEEGESYSEALVREIQEELGVDIVVGEQLESSTMTFETAVVSLVPFMCSSKILPESSSDHSEFKWLLPEDLFRLEWMLLDIPIVEQIRKRK